MVNAVATSAGINGKSNNMNNHDMFLKNDNGPDAFCWGLSWDECSALW
jgi:hypothetical protein